MATTIERKQAHWRGETWSWFEAGQGEEALCLLHGGGGTGKAWLHQMEYFHDQYRVICPDLPGFGQSSYLKGFDSPDALGGIILEWMASLGITEFILGGNSMGGRVALSTALKAPERIRALLLLNAVGITLEDVPIVNPLSLPPEQFMSGLVYDRENYKRNTPYRTLEDAKELNHGRTVFAQYVQNTPIGADPSWDLKKIACPTLLLWGRHDHIIPVPYGRAMAKILPHAELLVIEDCGHLPHIEEPAITNATIQDFLSRQLGAPTPHR